MVQFPGILVPVVLMTEVHGLEHVPSIDVGAETRPEWVTIGPHGGGGISSRSVTLLSITPKETTPSVVVVRFLLLIVEVHDGSQAKR